MKAFYIIVSVAADARSIKDGVLVQSIQLPWQVTEDPEWGPLWKRACEFQANDRDDGRLDPDEVPLQGDVIQTEKELILFMERCDTDEGSWSLLKMGKGGIEEVSQDSGTYYPPQWEDE